MDSPLSPSEIKKRVDRGLQIRTQIEALKDELKDIERALEYTGLASQHEPLNEPDREGRQWFAHGSELTVPVIFESDCLMGSFPEGGQAHSNILAALDSHADKFTALWKPVSKFEMAAKDGQSYRRILREILPYGIGADVLSASISRDKNGIAKSRIIVDWNRPKLNPKTPAEV